jgi:hypothetical protein
MYSIYAKSWKLAVEDYENEKSNATHGFFHKTKKKGLGNISMEAPKNKQSVNSDQSSII